MLSNLPDRLTSFVGRGREIAEIRHLLRDTRLLTLIGAGGCGKTRLALEVAARPVERVKDGVCWVELAALSKSAQIDVARALAQWFWVPIRNNSDPGRRL